MKSLKIFLAGFILIELSLSCVSPKAGAEDYYTQDQQNKKILKEGVVGAGVGALAAGTSGGSAGKGALIGAGTNVIGSALIDTLTSSPSPQPPPQVQVVQQAPEAGYTVVEDRPRNGGCGRSR